MRAASTFESSINLYQTTLRNKPKKKIRLLAALKTPNVKFEALF
jgi:hypothetical protein